MDIRERMQAEVKRSGTRVEQRLQLLELVCSEDGVATLQRRLDQAEAELSAALAALRKEVAGG